MCMRIAMCMDKCTDTRTDLEVGCVAWRVRRREDRLVLGVGVGVGVILDIAEMVHDTRTPDRHVWICMEQTCVDMYGHVRTCTDIYVHAWTCTDMYGHIWACMGMYGHIWTCMDMHGHVAWTRMDMCMDMCINMCRHARLHATATSLRTHARARTHTHTHTRTRARIPELGGAGHICHTHVGACDGKFECRLGPLGPSATGRACGTCVCVDTCMDACAGYEHVYGHAEGQWTCVWTCARTDV